MYFAHAIQSRRGRTGAALIILAIIGILIAAVAWLSRMPGHEAMKRLAILAVLLLNLALVFL
jgi:hypothetical protein